MDLAKRVIQVQRVDAAGRVVTSRALARDNRALARDKFIEWCVMLPAGCIVAMQASASAHHCARKLIGLGLDARIISAQLVSPYRSEGATGKNDANDAAAIREAASRPTMRFIPVKSIEQQSMLCVHRLREGIKEDGTACINRIRGLLAEFGLVFPQNPKALRQVLSEVIEDTHNEMGSLARLALQRAQVQWEELDAHMHQCDERVGAHVKTDPQAKAAARLHGIGPICASAIVTSVGEFKQFRSGDQFGAGLGIVPRQNACGGKPSRGRITKWGDDYLRTLLIQGARSAVLTAHKRKDRVSRWTVQLRARVGWQKAAVALANKDARILCAVMAQGSLFSVSMHRHGARASRISQTSPEGQFNSHRLDLT